MRNTERLILKNQVEIMNVLWHLLTANHPAETYTINRIASHEAKVRDIIDTDTRS